MNRHVNFIVFTVACCATMTFAQVAPPPSTPPPSTRLPSASPRTGAPRTAPVAAPKTTGDYPSDVGTVLDAQEQALNQAKQAAAEAQDEKVRTSLETAIKEMQKAQAALEAAKNSPEKLAPAI